jgi:hypothetical protein
MVAVVDALKEAVPACAIWTIDLRTARAFHGQKIDRTDASVSKVRMT